MIDPEALVYAEIAASLRASYDKLFVTAEDVDVPAEFPAVTVQMIDNSVDRKMRTAEEIENSAKVAFQVDAYSNKVGYKKSEVKDLIEAVDTKMKELGFERTMCSPVTNLLDTTIARMTARYEGEVDKDYWVYQS